MAAACQFWRGRILRGSKWACLAGSLAMLSAIAASWRCWLVYSFHPGGWRDSAVFKIADGVAGYYPEPMAFGLAAPASSRLEIGPPPRWHERFWSWWPHMFGFGGRWTSVYLPLHFPATGLALVTAWLFLRDRRSMRWAREGRCAECGYDLSGVSGKCPECGKGRS